MAADSVAPEPVQRSGLVERLGNQLPLAQRVTNVRGESVPMSSLISPFKPTIVVFAYYTCPMLCNLVLTGLRDAVQGTDLQLGDRYNVLTISIDPLDTPATAKAFQDRYTKGLVGGASWQFFTGTAESVKSIASSVGFTYYYDTKTKEYAHAAGVIVLAPGGTVTRLLYGIEFKPKDLKLAILEASDRKQVSTIEKMMLFCYNYDPDKRGYAVHARNVMKIGAGIFVVILGGLIALLTLKRNEKSNGQ